MTPEQRLLPPLVFIHGIKGSVLTDSRGGVRWIDWEQAFGLCTPDLSLPLRWNGEVQQHDDLVAGAPLRAVAWHDIYAPFLDWASASGQAFRPFAYDWRRDNLESATEFIKLLENVSQKHGGARIQVVAHSMGGLITFVALNRRPDLFHSVLFAGVPFGHNISFLEDMHCGIAIGLNTTILSPQVLFTFASPYSLFPWNTRDSGLVEVNGHGIPHNWYSAEDWERHKLGIFAAIGQDRVTDDQRGHLQNALRQALDFRCILVCKAEKSFQYPPLAVLASKTRPTLTTVVRGGPHAIRGWDFRSAAKKLGDGRVEFSAALPPRGVPYEIYTTMRDHGGLLNNTHQIAAILAKLGERNSSFLGRLPVPSRDGRT